MSRAAVRWQRRQSLVPKIPSASELYEANATPGFFTVSLCILGYPGVRNLKIQRARVRFWFISRYFNFLKCLQTENFPRAQDATVATELYYM
jgi:hypothetical protein